MTRFFRNRDQYDYSYVCGMLEQDLRSIFQETELCPQELARIFEIREVVVINEFSGKGKSQERELIFLDKSHPKYGPKRIAYNGIDFSEACFG